MSHTSIMGLRRGWRVLALGLILVLLGGAPAGALEQKTKPVKGEVTLRQALSMALSYSPNIKQTLAQLEKATSQKKEAFTYFLPTLRTSYGWQKTQNPPMFRTGTMNVVVGRGRHLSVVHRPEPAPVHRLPHCQPI